MTASSDIGVELGNSKFSVCVRGEGIVAHESAYLAYTGEIPTKSSIVAIGDVARDMFERSHSGIQVVTPMREGIVVDCHVAGLILSSMTKKIGLNWFWSRPKILVAALFGSSNVERKAFLDVARNVHCKDAFIVHEPLAAANGIEKIDISGPYSNLVVDVGDGATEALLVSSGKTIIGNSMRFGGKNVDLLIIDHVHRRHGLRISSSQARRIKEMLTLSHDAIDERRISVKGLAVDRFLPREKFIPASDFAPVLHSAADTIADFVVDTLAKIPPEASVDLIENGIYICGGASQMSFVKEALEKRTKLVVHRVADPDRAVIRGLNRMLDFTNYYS